MFCFGRNKNSIDWNPHLAVVDSKISSHILTKEKIIIEKFPVYHRMELCFNFLFVHFSLL